MFRAFQSLSSIHSLHVLPRPQPPPSPVPTDDPVSTQQLMRFLLYGCGYVVIPSVVSGPYAVLPPKPLSDASDISSSCSSSSDDSSLVQAS